MAGSIGSISVSIPLASLRSKPTIITIDEIYLLVAPCFDGKPVSSLIVAAAKAKNVLLNQIEKHYIAASLGAPKGAIPTPDDDSKLFDGLIGTIIANLQISVTRVHIRYEHPLSIVPAPGGRGLDQVRDILSSAPSLLICHDEFDEFRSAG